MIILETFPLWVHPWAATVDMVSTPRAPAPENFATLLPNTESNEKHNRITSLLWGRLTWRKWEKENIHNHSISTIIIIIIIKHTLPVQIKWVSVNAFFNMELPSNVGHLIFMKLTAYREIKHSRKLGNLDSMP